MLRIVRIQPQFSGKGVLGHSPKRVLVWGPRRDARPAGERRSGGALEGCLSHRDSDPTWSKARDDAYAQKERPGGEPHRLCTLQNQRDAVRRDETIAIVCAVNPSVSLTAASSPYTGKPFGWGDALPLRKGGYGHEKAPGRWSPQGSFLIKFNLNGPRSHPPNRRYRIRPLKPGGRGGQRPPHRR